MHGGHRATLDGQLGFTRGGLAGSGSGGVVMDANQRASLIALATFIVMMPVFFGFFLWAMDQDATRAIAYSVAPAIGSAAAMFWQYREK